MVEDQDPTPSLDFPINSSLSKRPDQLATLLDSALQREFPEALDIVEIAQVSNPSYTKNGSVRNRPTPRDLRAPTMAG